MLPRSVGPRMSPNKQPTYVAQPVAGAANTYYGTTAAPQVAFPNARGATNHYPTLSQTGGQHFQVCLNNNKCITTRRMNFSNAILVIIIIAIAIVVF